MAGIPILWPLRSGMDGPGYIYGWSHPLICVAGVIKADTRNDATQVLQRALLNNDLVLCKQICAEGPAILGSCTPSPSNHHDCIPQLHLDGETESCSRVRPLVHYKPPKWAAMQFYSVDYAELDILPSQILGGSFGSPSNHSMRILKHDFMQPSFNMRPGLDAAVLNQLNISQYLVDVVNQTQDAHHIDTTQGQSPRSSPPLSNSHPEDHQIFASAGIMHRFAQISATLSMLLRDVSSTVEQLDVRTEQAKFVFARPATSFARNTPRSMESISRYVKYYNCIWLVLNDVIIGVAFGSFLCENNLVLSHILSYWAQYYLVDCMQRALLWLNNWPAGLKLNTELSQFYCHTLLGIISLWGRVLQFAAPYFPAMFWAVGLMGCCGMTMIVSLLSDVFTLLTAHLHLCYFLTTTAFSQELSLAGSLWNLFRGKRFNVLRNRLDSWDYDMDQLLLGTILFTLVAFLYPTVLTYYALFAMTHLTIVVLHAVLNTVVALLNHFPLFALMLRVKDPMRLPGQITFRRDATGSLMLQNEPAPLTSIFMHYLHLWSRLSSHYNPLRLMRLMMSGRQLKPIPRASIRFSMIHSHQEADNGSL